MMHIQACDVKLRTVAATFPRNYCKGDCVTFALCMLEQERGTASSAETRPVLKRSGEAHNVRAAAPITLEVLVRDAANLLTLD